MRRKITLLIALFALCATSWATEIGPIDGFYYDVDANGDATLIKDPTAGEFYSYNASVASGAITIPATVNDGGNNYSVKYIGDYAFVSCDITSVEIEEGVETIGAHAFDLCSSLRTVSIPSTVYMLSGQVFDNSALTTITCKATTPPFLFSTFDNVPNTLVHIYVPSASVDAYKTASDMASGWSNFASIIEAIPAPSSTITWNAENGLTDIYLSEWETDAYKYHDGSKSATIANVTATISATTNSSQAEFKNQSGNMQIGLDGNGTLTFSIATGQFQSIVINTNNGSGYKNNPGDWTWNNNNHTLTWNGALPSNSVVLDDASVDNITSIVFTLAGAAPASAGTITWGSRQVDHVSLYGYYADQVFTSSVVKGIITSLERTGEGNYDDCYFSGSQIKNNNCGEITFQSIVGELTGIVIACSDVTSATGLSADWTYDSSAKTLTWDGTAADEVTLSGNINCNISSIEFSYTPASAPRLGETFTGSFGQIYEITGAHTAKVVPQSFTGTFNVLESETDGGVTYYITEIADNAFYNNGSDLSNVYIGENVAIIGAHAFENNSHMYEVFVYSTVLDAIGDAAFKNCQLIHGFECNTSMPPALGSNVFEGDTRINRIAVSNTSSYQYADGWSTYSDKIVGSWVAPSVGEIFFWSNQTTVNLFAVTEGATYNTTGKAKVMPYTSDVNAIYPISRTDKLIIPEQVSYMGRPYDVTGIGANAYKDETGIDMVIMPLAVTSIETGAFQGCNGVTTVQFLWDDPTTVTWADGNVGAEFKTAANGGTKIVVPEGRLEAYKTWAPAWAGCMTEGAIVDVDVTQAEDPDHAGRYYRTFYDGSTDYMLPPSVWAHVGYVENDEFILRPIAFDGQVVARGTAVVLESETPTYRLIPMGNTAPLYTGQNDLEGLDVNTAVSTVAANHSVTTDKIYVLNKEATVGGNLQTGMGMYQYTGSTLGAHKAYLIYTGTGSGPSSAPKRFLFRHEDSATGIDNTNANVQSTKLLRDGQLIIIRGDKEFNAQGQVLK